jgi:hypothetical protein
MTRDEKMDDFLEIKCLSKKDQEKIQEEIEKKIEQKIKDGTYTEREVLEIQHMKLRALPDILDVQSVFERLKF